MKNPKSSAKNVQCIHTDGLFGTMMRNCNQDWLMGQCGLTQVAASTSFYQAHRLCPILYNSAFTNRFNAVLKPNICPFEKNTFPIVHGDSVHFMGYHNR